MLIFNHFEKMLNKLQFKDCAVLIFIAVFIIFFAASGKYIGLFSSNHPYVSGFISFSLFSTFGECLGLRIASGRWLPQRLTHRMMVWGIFGIWISAAFPFTAGGVKALTASALWPTMFGAFSVSIWANILSGYAPFMMATHYWTDSLIAGKVRWPWEIFGDAGFPGWARTVVMSLVLFWVPAHTITFILPDYWRTQFAATLGIMLGVILTFGPKNSKHGSSINLD